jgi:hypothetical protein
MQSRRTVHGAAGANSRPANRPPFNRFSMNAEIVGVETLSTNVVPK